MKTRNLLIVLIFCTVSCKSFLAIKYKTNQPFTFKTKQAYIDYLEKKKHFEKDHLVFLDATTYNRIFDVLSNSYPVYYGSFINDSTEIKKSNHLMINEECMGRMDGEIKKNIAQENHFDTMLITSTNLNRFHLLKAITNAPLNINGNDHRLKVFMFYGFAQGSVYDELYKEVYKTYYETNRGFDLYIMLIDPLYNLPD